MNYRVPSSYSPYAAVPFGLMWFPLHSEAFLFLGLCSADLRLFSRYQLINGVCSSVVFVNVLVIDDVIGLFIQFLPEDP